MLYNTKAATPTQATASARRDPSLLLKIRHGRRRLVHSRRVRRGRLVLLGGRFAALVSGVQVSLHPRGWGGGLGGESGVVGGGEMRLEAGESFWGRAREESLIQTLSEFDSNMPKTECSREITVTDL